MTSERQYFRKIARGGALAVTGKLVTYPLGLLLAIVLARVLTPAELGGYFLATSLVLVAATVAQFGVGPVMVKFVAAALAVNDQGRARQTLVLGLGWLAATSLIVVVAFRCGAGDWLVDLLREGDILRPSLVIVAWLVVAHATVSFCCEALRGFSDLGSASLFAEQLLQRFLLLLVLIIPWLLDVDLDLYAVLGLMVASFSASAFLGLAFVWFKFRRLRRGADEPVRAAELLRNAPPFFLMRLNFWLMDTAPVWILGMFHPPEIVALYGVGNLFGLIVLAPWTVANTSLGPAIVKLHTENRHQLLRKMLGTIAGISTLVSGCVVAALILFGHQILATVFTQALVPAYATTVILALGRGVSVSFGAPGLLLAMTQHHTAVSRVLMVSSGLGLVLYFLAARFGTIEWVALTGAVMSVSQAVTLAFIARRVLGISTLPTFRVGDWRQIAGHLFQRS